MINLSPEEEKESKPTKRQQAEKQQRRRRKTGGDGFNLKLSVDEGEKDPNFVYRWINDNVGGRMMEMTVHDDWDQVTKEQMSADPDKDSKEGTPIKRIVGEKNGQPLHAYLCRKPREYFEEDERDKQAEIDAVEQDMRRGAPADPKGIEQSTSYVPGGTNTIRHGE